MNGERVPLAVFTARNRVDRGRGNPLFGLAIRLIKKRIFEISAAIFARVIGKVSGPLFRHFDWPVIIRKSPRLKNPRECRRIKRQYQSPDNLSQPNPARLASTSHKTPIKSKNPVKWRCMHKNAHFSN
ncbi:hypothetical protein BJG93_36165 [Paraburkholderia sprentiae WSM5005]|uniref:Uncharacterized protein n=1 Tax=Paraburkholderia sprentiae WSM5005 TaxID=754502 RepID=A0A8F4KJ18_9BURK|nr:hypothetical protein [Paraburkholderia sprentiae]QXE07257.1 hypothetical protein BJG93_36165 [Paraburkholderia sprentiae WSM5005]